MLKKLIVGSIVLVVVVLAGGAWLVRSWLDADGVRRTLEQQASQALGQPVAIGKVDLSFWPRAGVTLHDLTVGQPTALTLKRTALSTAMRALFNRRVEDAELLVEDSTVDLPLLLAALDRLSAADDSAPAASPVDTPVPAGGDETPALTVINVRTIALRNIRVQSGSRSAVLTLQSSLEGDRLQVDHATITSDVTALEATGAVESLTSRRAALSVTAESLDMDGLLVFAQEFAQHAQPPAAGASTATASDASGPMDITLDINAARGRVGGAPFDQLKGTVRVTPGQVALAPLSLGLFAGQLSGEVRADLSGAEPAVAIKGSLNGIDMAQLTEFAGQPGAITGRLNGTMSLQTSGADASRVLTATRGNGSVTISDGTIKGLQIVRPVVLAFGKPDMAQPMAGGERFDRMDTSFTMARGVVTLDTLTFQSRDVEMDGSGPVDLTGSTVDLQANVRLSRELTAQAGRDLVRYTADDGRVTVPARITGPLDAPQVGVDMAGLTRRAVTNELQRQADDLKRQGESAIRGLLRKKGG